MIATTTACRIQPFERQRKKHVADEDEGFRNDEGAGRGEGELPAQDLIAADGRESENPELPPFERNQREHEAAQPPYSRMDVPLRFIRLMAQLSITAKSPV